MRALVLVLGLLLVGACGDAGVHARAPLPKEAELPLFARPGPETDKPGPTLGAPSPSFSPSGRAVGSLERPQTLRHLFEALARLDDGQAKDDVRIVQFGDSHTAADFETGPLRRALQARFGDGGRGFVPIGKPWKWYVQEGLSSLGMVGWTMDRGKPARGGFVGDGRYGLLGVSIRASKPGARAWTSVSAPASRLEVAFLGQPQGGSVDLIVDGERKARIKTRAKEQVSAFQTVELPEETHQIEVQAVGDGAVRVFGMSLDRQKTGIVVDSLGINGARIGNFLTWNEGHMSEQLRHRAPDLVVLAYGTNEAGDDTPIAFYERQLVDALGRVARAVPSASCLLLGPPDRASRTDDGWATMPRLLEIEAAQRRVAAAGGCAFYSQLEAMGGPGTIAAWALEDKPRAMVDRVHLSREGYAELARQIASDLVQAYAEYRADKHLPAVAAPPPSAPLPVPPAHPAPAVPKNEPVAQASPAP